MNWEAIGALGELIGSLAVVISLIYVAMQLRENTRSMHAAETNEVANGLQNITESIQRDPATKRVFHDIIFAKESFLSLSDEEQFDVHLILQIAFLNLWRAYKASNLGYSDDELWFACIAIIRRSYFPFPLVREWWEDRGRSPFPENFRTLVDEEFRKAQVGK